jgi:hypothetical protein
MGRPGDLVVIARGAMLYDCSSDEGLRRMPSRAKAWELDGDAVAVFLGTCPYDDKDALVLVGQALRWVRLGDNVVLARARGPRASSGPTPGQGRIPHLGHTGHT